jgi:Rap1a immunity proteins
MKSVGIAAMMLVAAVTSPAAEEVSYENSGAWLLQRCESSTRAGWEVGYCLGYTNAASDVLTRIPESGYCPPPGLTNTQIMRVVVKSLQAHPEKLHLNVAALTLDAIMAAFPCPK